MEIPTPRFAHPTNVATVVRLLQSYRYNVRAIARDTGISAKTVRSLRSGHYVRPYRSTIDTLLSWFHQYAGLPLEKP
jgi:hypothetical protein